MLQRVFFVGLVHECGATITGAGPVSLGDLLHAGPGRDVLSFLSPGEVQESAAMVSRLFHDFSNQLTQSSPPTYAQDLHDLKKIVDEQELNGIT